MKNTNPGRFKHTCPVCNENFVGRRNQKYDKIECKTKANNDNAYELRQIAKNFDNQLHSNHKILDLFFPESNGKKAIDISPLNRMGFDGNVSSGLLTHEETNGMSYRVYNLAFVLTDGGKKIIIFKYEK